LFNVPSRAVSLSEQRKITVIGKASILLAGIDTLIVNVKQLDEQGKPRVEQILEEEMALLLESWQAAAKTKEEPYVTTWEHERYKLKMQPHGTSSWRWLLKNGLIDVMIGSQLHHASLVRVRFSSEYLWRYGIETAVKHTHAFLQHTFGRLFHLQPAEIHLCIDMVGLHIPKDYEQVFVSRAATMRPIKESALEGAVYRYRKLETLQFSKHGNALSAVIYNKFAEIEKKSTTKKWFYDLWKAQGWDETSPVWRVECRLERKALSEMKQEIVTVKQDGTEHCETIFHGIDDVYDALKLVPALWAYCVGHPGQRDGWLRMVIPNPQDTNRRRWQTTQGWETVQRAFNQWKTQLDMEELQRERKRAVNLDRAEKAIAGYTTTYAAWLKDELQSDDDVSVVLHRLYGKMLDLWEKRGVDFPMLRQKKRFLYHLD
jgi:hypothetical protein